MTDFLGSHRYKITANKFNGKKVIEAIDLNRTSFIITFALTPKMVSLSYTTQFQSSFVLVGFEGFVRFLTREGVEFAQRPKSSVIKMTYQQWRWWFLPADPKLMVTKGVSKSKCLKLAFDLTWSELERNWLLNERRFAVMQGSNEYGYGFSSYLLLSSPKTSRVETAQSCSSNVAPPQLAKGKKGGAGWWGLQD